MNGYEVLCPKGSLLGIIERRFVRGMNVESTAVAVELVQATGGRTGDVRSAQFQISSCAGREVIRACPDEVRRLVGFIPRARVDLWGLFRVRLAAIGRPIAIFSEGARDLGTLIDDVRAVMLESDGLSPGRVALIELAWQRMHTIHDPELAGVRLNDALRPGPDILHSD
ncbi:MAG: hypothetical protein JWO51_2144 [Rhodospirillales bacterium]|nr:hypothetical protein [Rhodospirillales bacterium]